MSAPIVPVEGRTRGATSRAAMAVVVGGLVAGLVDIGAAALINMTDPRLVLRFIAGGVQGGSALSGGTASAWLGLALQWSMSTLIAMIFVFTAVRMRCLTTRWIAAGLAYGLVVFVVMNYVVMPLSAWHRIDHFSPSSFIENIAAMLLFGLIIAFSARHVAVHSMDA